jgi:hypothetical protein
MTMDPKAALIAALAGDSQAARAYNQWIQRGGFAVRVAIDPATDLFMRGIRYADVRWVGRTRLTITEQTVRGRYTGGIPMRDVTVPTWSQPPIRLAERREATS